MAKETARPRRVVGVWRVVVVAPIALGIPVLTFAQPDFSRSTLTHEPAHVVEGDVVTFLAHIRNTGDEAAPYAEIEFLIPWEALLAEMQGLDAAEIDHPSKRIATTAHLEPGADLSSRVRVVVPRDAGGHVLRPNLHVRYLHRGVAFEAGEPIDIGTAPATGGVRLGGVRIGASEAAVFAVIALYPLLWLILPRRRRNHGTVMAITLGTAFLGFFATMAWRDWQTLTTWRGTACTILDTRLRVDVATSRLPTASSNTPRPRRENTTYTPLLAVKYDIGGEDVISTGYDTGTRLGLGAGEARQREYAGWQIGAQVPCWFNPADPRDVVVVRGFGGAYLFALIPLAVLGLGIISLRRRR